MESSSILQSPVKMEEGLLLGTNAILARSSTRVLVYPLHHELQRTHTARFIQTECNFVEDESSYQDLGTRLLPLPTQAMALPTPSPPCSDLHL